MSLLELRDVEVVYGRHGRNPVRAVAGASLTVERGQIIGLVGESGCGKSSLARVGVGLVAPSAGEVLFEDQPLTPLGRAARPAREARLQMVFQNPYASLNPRRRVGTQIRAAMTLGGRKQARDERVAELLEQVGMSPGAARRYPHEFSGGQRQRIAIARALAADPSCIVLDEPLSSLDASAQAQVANLLVRLARELDLGLLLISHDLAIVRHVCDAISVMYLGLIVESGAASAVWADPSTLHRGADLGDPARRRRRRPAARAARRGARPGAAAERLPLPPALPPRLRPLLGGGPAPLRARRRPLRGLLPARSRAPKEPE